VRVAPLGVGLPARVLMPMCVCVCGCVGVWVCGCVGVWVWVWVWAGRLVGSGLHSNEAGFHLMLHEGVFDTRCVAHVRDIFDFHPERPHLSTVFGFASLDICIMDEVRLCACACARTCV
jgi:hypothetical protein